MPVLQWMAGGALCMLRCPSSRATRIVRLCDLVPVFLLPSRRGLASGARPSVTEPLSPPGERLAALRRENEVLECLKKELGDVVRRKLVHDLRVQPTTGAVSFAVDPAAGNVAETCRTSLRGLPSPRTIAGHRSLS